MRLVLLLACCLWASAAQAVDDWGNKILVGSTETSVDCLTGNQVGGSGRICFDKDSTATPASATFAVTGGSALACLKTDIDQEGVSATGASPITALIRFGPYGDTSSTGNSGIQVCLPAGCTLTGLNGVPSAQLACIQIGPGVYRVDFPTIPDSPDVAIFTVQGGP